MKVSIIMPAYNSEKYISEAVDSVINQSLSDWELIIIDDGSTDCTGKITDEYSQMDFRIKVFHQSNKGVSAARNYALERITGGYVTFLDSYDVYHPERLKMMVDELSEDPDCDAVFANYQEFRGNTRIDIVDSVINSAEVLQEKIAEKVIQDSRLQFMWNVMMKSEIAKNVRFADLKFAEDYCFIRDCSCYMKKITVINPVLYYYRRDNENAMTSHFFDEKNVPEYMKLVINMYQFCIDHEYNSSFYRGMVAHEYAQNAMRIRKSTSYRKFVKCMEDVTFRKGIDFADPSMCSLFETVLFWMLQHRFYILYALWVW